MTDEFVRKMNKRHEIVGKVLTNCNTLETIMTTMIRCYYFGPIMEKSAEFYNTFLMGTTGQIFNIFNTLNFKVPVGEEKKFDDSKKEILELVKIRNTLAHGELFLINPDGTYHLWNKKSKWFDFSEDFAKAYENRTWKVIISLSMIMNYNKWYDTA